MVGTSSMFLVLIKLTLFPRDTCSVSLWNKVMLRNINAHKIDWLCLIYEGLRTKPRNISLHPPNLSRYYIQCTKSVEAIIYTSLPKVDRVRPPSRVTETASESALPLKLNLNKCKGISTL